MTPLEIHSIVTVADALGRLASLGMVGAVLPTGPQVGFVVATAERSRKKRYARLLAVARMRVSVLSFSTKEYS